jgi:hypothetical protein
MVVAFIAAGVISRDMRGMRTEMYGDVAEARVKMKYFPVLGMDKFYGDIEWIRLIQKMGNPKISMKNDDPQSKVSAEFFFKKLNKITSLSPDINTVYMVGARHISNVLPQQSIQLLKKAAKYSTLTEWKNYEYMAFVERQYVAKKLEGEAKKKSLENAAMWYEKAMNMSGASAHVESAWLRIQASLKGLTNDDFGRFTLEYNYLMDKQDLSGGEEGVDAGVTSENSELVERLMGNARALAVDLWVKMKKAPGAEKAALKEKHDKVSKMFKEIAPKGHYSAASLSSYGPGDKFDVVTGEPVPVYGICAGCQKGGKTVVIRGQHCHACGMKTGK